MVRASHITARRDDIRDPALTALLFVQCLLIFVAAPIASAGFQGSHLVLEVTLLAFGGLVVFVSRGRIATAGAALAMLLGLIPAFQNMLTSARPTQLLSHAGSVGACLVVAYVVGRAVFAPGNVTSHRVRGAIVLYLNFGMIFAVAYRLIWDLDAGAFNGLPGNSGVASAGGTLLYFSFVTLTTVGYGDILPIHPIARSLANLEGIVGVLFPATFLARIISLQMEMRNRLR